MEEIPAVLKLLLLVHTLISFTKDRILSQLEEPVRL
jgi:hypothetical protein